MPKTPRAVKADAATTMLPPTATITVLVFGRKRKLFSVDSLVMVVLFVMVVMVEVMDCKFIDRSEVGDGIK